MEHGGATPVWQIAAAQRRDEPAYGPVTLAGNAVDGEDDPGAPDLWVETTCIRLTRGGNDLFAVGGALVDPINGEADVDPRLTGTAHLLFADHGAAEDSIRLA